MEHATYLSCALVRVKLLHEGGSAFSKGLSCFIQSFLITNVMPELCIGILFEKASISCINFIDNESRKFSLLWFGTGNIRHLVFFHQGAEIFIASYNKREKVRVNRNEKKYYCFPILKRTVKAVDKTKEVSPVFSHSCTIATFAVIPLFHYLLACVPSSCQDICITRSGNTSVKIRTIRHGGNTAAEVC